MSNKGYLTNAREKGFAKVLDHLFDFKKIVPDKKVLFGLINIQDFLEKRDYNIFLLCIRLIDDGLLAKDMNIQAAAQFDKALGYLENKDIDGFNEYVADLASGKIDIPLVDNDRAIFLNVLNLMKSLINMVVEKVKQAIAEVDAEMAGYEKKSDETEKTE